LPSDPGANPKLAGRRKSTGTFVRPVVPEPPA
jgi:hypothetical protein